MFRKATTRRNIQYRVEIIEDNDETSQAGQLKMEIKKQKKKKRAAPGMQVNKEGEEEGEADDVVEQQVCAIMRAWTATHAEGKVIVYGSTIQRV
jgi:multidrug efflux pump subunit AcrB